MYNYLFLILIILIFLFLLFQLFWLNNRKKKIMDILSRYEKIVDEQGKKNHEYNNQLMIIKGYINNKIKLNKYLDSIIGEHRVGQNYFIRQLSMIPSGGIKELLYYKLSKMLDLSIKHYLYVSNDVGNCFENLNFKTYKDITKILGVYLDNAIDAASKSKNKEIEINLKKEDKYIVISIGNSFDDKESIDKIGNKGFSTKGKGHGFGLSIVKEIVKENKKIEVLTDVNNNLFFQTVLIDLN